MGLLDKILGRGKQAAGDVMGDSSMRREGAAQEREANAQERAERHEELAAEQRQQAADARVEREGS
ncbi:MAG TPA: CsbD family protein [Gaiellaceae bacterium]